jgi:diguanylate cyclase
MDIASLQRLLPPGWLESAERRRGLAISGIAVLLICAAALVYLTGGTRYAYLHAIYLPIILAAVVFKVPGGILAGIAAGLLVGPFMPIDTATGQQQHAVNWLSRMGAFMVVGAFTGWIAGRLMEQVRSLRWSVNHNVNTGLPNRRALSEDLRPLLERAEGHGGAQLLVVRIENLDEILNTLGYPVSQALLQAVAQRLDEFTPEGSRVYQVHADRLAVLIPASPEGSRDAQSVAHKVLSAMRRSVPTGEVNVHASVVLGIAQLHDAEGDPDALIRRADIALYAGLRRGARFALYDIGADRTSRGNLALVGEVLDGIREGQFVLHYQPKLNLVNGRIEGVEALVRWQHPLRGMVPPGDFIPQVETTDLISSLSRWVIEEAIRQQGRWNAMGLKLNMSVNLSVKNLYEDALLEDVRALLKAHDLRPESLEFEVTESAIMQDPGRALDALRAVRDLGIHLSIDDFGTGYSSLSYLHEIPADIVKIDRSFITRMNDNEQVARIVESTIALSHYLNMTVVAEGVSNQRHLDTVAAYGCDAAQGFLIARPMEAKAIEEWLEKADWPQPRGLRLHRSDMDAIHMIMTPSA